MDAAKSSTTKTQGNTQTSFTPQKSASQGNMSGARKVTVDSDKQKDKSASTVTSSHKSGVFGNIFGRSKEKEHEEKKVSNPPDEKKVINPIFKSPSPPNDKSPQRPRATSTDLQHLQPVRRTRSHSNAYKKPESITTLPFSLPEESLLSNAGISDCSSSSSTLNSDPDSSNLSRSPSSPPTSPRKPEETYNSAKSGMRIELVPANPMTPKIPSKNHTYTQNDVEAMLNRLKICDGNFFLMQKTTHKYVTLEPSLSDSLESLDVNAIEEALVKKDFSKLSSLYNLPRDQADKLYEILAPNDVPEVKRLDILRKMQEAREKRLKNLPSSHERTPDTHYATIEKLFRNQLQEKARDEALAVFKEHLDVIECHNLYHSLLTIKERLALFKQTYASMLGNTRQEGLRALFNVDGTLIFEKLSINTIDCKQLLTTIAEPTRENRLAILLQTIYDHGWQPKTLQANFNALDEAQKMCRQEASPFWPLFYRLNGTHLGHALAALCKEFPKFKEMGYELFHNSSSAIKAGYHALINSEKDFTVIQVTPLALYWRGKENPKLFQALNLHVALVLRCKETDKGIQQEADTVILEGQWGMDADKLSSEQERHLIEAFYSKYGFTINPSLLRNKK